MPDHLALLKAVDWAGVHYSFKAVSNHLVLLRHLLRHPAHYCFRAVLNHLVLLHRRVVQGRTAGFRAVSNHLVLLQRQATCDLIGVVSEPCQITWFFCHQCRWRSRLSVSEPCQITWFFYCSGSLVPPIRVSGLCQIAWFFYQSRRFSRAYLFLDRVRSPGSSTFLVICAQKGFRAALNHLVLLRLLPGKYDIKVSGPCQIAWFFNIVLLSKQAAAVSGLCQITWFFYG